MGTIENAHLELLLPKLSISGTKIYSQKGNLAQLADKVFQYEKIHSSKGMTCRAFYASLSAILDDWLLTWTTTPDNKIKNLHYTTFDSIKAMCSWLDSISGLEGCNLLDELYSIWLKTGNEYHKTTLEKLLSDSSKPVLKILQNLVDNGYLYDPHNEFFLVQRPFSYQLAERWWETGIIFSSEKLDNPAVSSSNINVQKIPKFLLSVSQKALTTGKLWFVLRQCSDTKNDDGSDAKLHYCTTKLKFAFNDLNFIQKHIQESYRKANVRLLTLLHSEYQLLSKLSLVKHYYLCSKADFLSTFLDSALNLLNSPKKSISITKLRAIFALSLKTSTFASGAGGKNQDVDMLRAEISSKTFLDMLLRVISVKVFQESQEFPYNNVSKGKSNSGIDYFTLSVSMKFPLSLFFSAKSLAKYQLLFRQFFTISAALHSLSETYVSMRSIVKTVHKLNTTENSAYLKFLGKAWNLSHSLDNSLKGLLSYISERVEVLYSKFWKDLQRVLIMVVNNPEDSHDKISFDSILEKHDFFLDESLKQSLLTDKELLLAQHSLFQQCFHFANETKRLTELMEEDLSKYLLDRSKINNLHSFELRIKEYRNVVETSSASYTSVKKSLDIAVRQIANIDGDIYLTGVLERM